jgi:hypothetical protein
VGYISQTKKKSSLYDKLHESHLFSKKGFMQSINFVWTQQVLADLELPVYKLIDGFIDLSLVDDCEKLLLPEFLK